MQEQLSNVKRQSFLPQFLVLLIPAYLGKLSFLLQKPTIFTSPFSSSVAVCSLNQVKEWVAGCLPSFILQGMAGGRVDLLKDFPRSFVMCVHPSLCTLISKCGGLASLES